MQGVDTLSGDTGHTFYILLIKIRILYCISIISFILKKNVILEKYKMMSPLTSRKDLEKKHLVLQIIYHSYDLCCLNTRLTDFWMQAGDFWMQG